MSERLEKIASKTAAEMYFAVGGEYRYSLILNALKEAVEGLTPEEVHNLCHNLEKTVSLEEFKEGCKKYQQKLFGKDPIMNEVPPNIEKKDFVPRYHGWYWWKGISNEVDCDGRPIVLPMWYVVHCWVNEGKCYALSAHFTSPMDQETMGGEWGGQVFPPKPND